MNHQVSASGILATVDVLLVCAVGLFAAWYSPNLKLDPWIALTGIALASAAFWRGCWSRSYLIRVAIGAYYFRCLAFWFLGTSPVRAIAISHAAIGVAALGIAYLAGKGLSICGMSGTPAEEQSTCQEPEV